MQKILKTFLLAVILFSGCASQTVGELKPLKRVDDVTITVGIGGTLDKDNTVKVFNLIRDLRATEDYCIARDSIRVQVTKEL